MAPLFKKTIAMDANSKPIWYKRIIATGFDIVTLFLTAYLAFYICNITPISNNARLYKQYMTEIEDDAKLITGYGYKEVINQGEEGDYLLHYDEENNEYYIVKNTDYPSSEITTEYKNIVNSNTKYSEYQFSYMINNYFIVMGCGLVSELIFLLIVPLTNKKRATCGQLLCGLQVISVKRQNRAAWYQILGRFFFIFIIESVIPYLIISMWVILAVPVITFIVRYFNKDNRSVYEFVTSTRLIEAQTFSPLIIEEDLKENIDTK